MAGSSSDDPATELRRCPKIIVEPKYVDVKIEADGTVLLRKITSEVVKMKLNP